MWQKAPAGQQREKPPRQPQPTTAPRLRHPSQLESSRPPGTLHAASQMNLGPRDDLQASPGPCRHHTGVHHPDTMPGPCLPPSSARPQAHLPQEGSSASGPACRALLGCRLETSVGQRENQHSVHPALPCQPPWDRQNCSPDVSVVVVPVLPLWHWKCHFSRHGGDGQLCPPGLGDSDSYKEQSCSRSKEARPATSPSPGACRVSPEHLPSHRLLHLRQVPRPLLGRESGGRGGSGAARQ